MKKHVYQNIIDKDKIIIRDISIKDIDTLMKLQIEIIDELENKDYYRLTTREMYLDYINAGFKIIGLYYDNELIAFGTMLGSNTYDKKFLDSPLFDNVNPQDIYYYKAVAVKSVYRGNGIQKWINNYLINYVVSIGGKYILLNVHPDNLVSIRNFEESGFVHYKDLILDDRYKRKIYYNKL